MITNNQYKPADMVQIKSNSEHNSESKGTGPTLLARERPFA